jgi:hypothetical protein
MAMKLRIHKGSLRFRFNREEVEALSRGEKLEETVRVGPGSDQNFGYSVAPSHEPFGEAGLRVQMQGQKLCVDVSAERLTAWHESAELSLSGQQTWDEQSVTVLLEKDMQRLNPKPGEESRELYPNPLYGKARCDHP